MTDPLTFPALAGAALTQAFGFLYGRLAALLDRRAEEEKAEKLSGENGKPAVLISEVSAVEPNYNLLKEHREQLETFASLLKIYLSSPELLDGEDEDVRRNLARLRDCLEKIYGQNFIFEGERRPASGLKITQEVGRVAGETMGLETGRFKGESSRVDIEQTAKEVPPGGKITGAKIERID